jgi:carboxypeptidase-like protein/secretin/TonB-like protein
MKLLTLKLNKKFFIPASQLLLCILICISSLEAQEKNTSDVRITIDVQDEPLFKVLSYIEKQTSFRFAYNSDLVLQQKNITFRGNLKISDLLDVIFEGTSITYTIIGNQIVIQKTVPDKITISGYTREKKSGESLIGTSIYLPATRRGAASNSYGFYSLSIQSSDSLELEISYSGYKAISIKIDGRRDVSLDFNLTLKQDSISPAIILKDKRDDNVKRNQVDLIDLSADIIAVSPTVSGNGDLISSVQLSAGVQAGLDGTTGYFVRGGNTDQNQVLLDEATLYNPSHLFNLVSVFNSSAIKKANFLKGGFPACYGDYLSSILDVYIKDGNNQESGGDLQIGNIASSLALHGPITPGKSSFLLSSRRSMIDQVLRPFTSMDYFNNYYFYDVNAKLNFQVSSKDKLLLSYYRGSDHNAYINSGNDDDEGEINYKVAFGNQAFNFRWNHLFTKKLFSNTQSIYSNYYQRLSAIQGDYFAQLYSGIRDISFKTDLYYYPRINQRIRGGINYLLQSVLPATLSNKISSTGFVKINQNDIPEKRSNRFAAYVSDDVKVTRNFNVYAGVRLPVFFKPDVRYINLEPRLSLLYLLSQTSSIKIAYSGMHQYIHLIQSYNASFPAEIWIGSSKIVKPQASQQVSGGLYKSFRQNMFQASIEAYYKLMDNQMLFKGITTPTIETNIESQLIFGKAWSYGTEFTIKKTSGDLTGWLSYSLSEAYQKFDSLNNGIKFLFSNNRKHNFYLSTSYDLNIHWTISANLFLTSGRSVTLNPQPVPSQGNQDDNPLFEDGDNNNGGSIALEPNNYRLTPYSRLDLGIGYRKIRSGKKRKWESEWNLSVYNVYAHQNTYFAYRSINPVTKQAFISQVSFIPVIPSLTYVLKF